MANLRVDNLCGTGGRNAIDGSVFFNSDGHGSTNNSNALSLADSTDWYFDGDFTIECWINPGKRPTTSGAFLGQWVSGGGTDRNVQLYIGTNGVVTGYMNRSTTNYSAGSVAALPVGEWSHIALVLESSTLRFYCNGTQTATASVSGTQNNGTSKFFVGAEANASGNPVYAFNGYLSNVRVIKGTALYAGGTTFTPPTEKLTAIDGTVLLCCQDSDDPTQEATGKTITGYGKLAAGQPKAPKVLPPVGVDEGVTFEGDIKMNSQGVMYFPTGDTSQRGRGRGIFADGDSSKTIEYISIQSLGNAIDFGDSTTDYKQRASVSSSTRTVTAGGFNSPSFTNVIDYITIATTSNATDFGDLTVARRGAGSAGNNTRGIFFGGNTPTLQDVIDYITIASVGNATDFGNTTTAKSTVGSLASPTRAVFGGGQSNVMEYVTIATTGNATDFGDLTSGTTEQPAGTSSSTRGLFICGESQPSGTRLNTIQYITIATTGNATDFGDNTFLQRGLSACNNSLRAVYGGGNDPSATLNTLSYVTIATTGNGQDFGDLTVARNLDTGVGSSDSHGGIS